MNKPENRRPVAVWCLLVMQAFLGVTALQGGASLLLDPSGAGLGLSLSQLSGTNLGSYLLPGLILFLVLGVGSLLVLFACWKRPGIEAPEPAERRGKPHWSWLAAAGLGCALLVWLTVQMALIGYRHFLQLAYAAIGVGMLVILQLPAVRRHFQQ